MRRTFLINVLLPFSIGRTFSRISSDPKYSRCGETTKGGDFSKNETERTRTRSRSIRIESARAGRKLNCREAIPRSAGPLHQFARDAAVYLTNDQILYAKKSTATREDVFFLLLPLFGSVRDTFPPRSRIHFTCQPRVIPYPSGYYNGAGEREPTDDT